MIHLDDKEDNEYQFFKLSEINQKIEDDCPDEEELGEVFEAKLPPLTWQKLESKPQELF